MFPEDPCYLLGKASRFIKCRIDSRLAEIGLTFSQYKIIATLYNENGAQGGPMTPADLADRACCERPTVTGIIDRLEKQGLVSREPNPNDRRSQAIRLTDKARGLLESMNRIFTDMKSQALDGFSEEEIDDLRNYLKHIISNVEKK